MIILGIDPGTSLIGYGVIEYSNYTYKALEYGAFRTEKNIENRDRVKDVHTFFQNLIKKHNPDRVSIEALFFFKNEKTVIKVSEIRGVLLLSAALHNTTIQEFTPLQVKQSVTGYGKADKEQVQRMVTMILGLKETPKPDDVADALALAICSANTIVY
jgi:crossover junction endodeoxyribonuclease RuvC